jgi:hypothetical protein
MYSQTKSWPASIASSAANCSLAKAQPGVVTGSIRAARLTWLPK